MAIYNLIGGTVSKLNITLHGGYNDIITLTNTRNGQKYENIELGSSTFKENFEIKSGTYKIESKFLTEVGLSLPEYEVKRGVNEVFAFPQNTVYWFGNGHKSGSYLLNKYGEYRTTGWVLHPENTNRSYTFFGDNHVRASIESNSGSTYRVLSTHTNKINLSSYNKAYFYGSKPWQSAEIRDKDSQNNWYVKYISGKWGKLGFSSNGSSLSVYDTSRSEVTQKILTVDVSSLTEGYCGLEAEACYNNTCNTYMYACWLE